MNKAFLIGNLTRDPELRSTQNGIQVCSFGLAVNRSRKVEGQPDVDFFNVTVWRQMAENCAKYLSKGRKVGVVGSLRIRTYDAQDGTKRTAVEIDATDVEFLPSGEKRDDSKSDHGEGFTPVEDDDLPF